jgi:hypothetical protein
MPIEQGDQFVATGLLIGNRRPIPGRAHSSRDRGKFMETRNQVDLGEKHVTGANTSSFSVNSWTR